MLQDYVHYSRQSMLILNGMWQYMTIIEDESTTWLSARIRREREAKGWSLGQFAAKSGVS